MWFKLSFSVLWSIWRVTLAVLISLQLARMVDISWWLVFLPLWVAAAMDILKQVWP